MLGLLCVCVNFHVMCSTECVGKREWVKVSMGRIRVVMGWWGVALYGVCLFSLSSLSPSCVPFVVHLFFDADRSLCLWCRFFFSFRQLLFMSGCVWVGFCQQDRWSWIRVGPGSVYVEGCFLPLLSSFSSSLPFRRFPDLLTSSSLTLVLIFLSVLPLLSPSLAFLRSP